jgi:hypothetical protein
MGKNEILESPGFVARKIALMLEYGDGGLALATFGSVNPASRFR